MTSGASRTRCAATPSRRTAWSTGRAVAGSGLLDNRDKQIRVQWCHGAPGIVATLGPLLEEDLALGGGELTWRAGPLEKGAGLCHGTSGNGYAFLVLFERTGDELWLMRARAFAMHALEQLQSERYSLWTGCLGVRSTSPTASTAVARFRSRDTRVSGAEIAGGPDVNPIHG